MAKRQMHLLGHICTGPSNHHSGSWRHAESDVDGVTDPARYERLATIYERGLFDGVFIVDYQLVRDLTPTKPSVVAQYGGQMAMLEPMLILAVMARVTKHLGLAATMSTSLNHAYHIARSFATLDHITGGRAGWNIVTSSFDQEARSYGRDALLEKSLRYKQADQTVEACLELWKSWEPDALVVDRGSGVFADSSKIHFTKYSGSMVQTEGALTTPRSPQTHPVFMQAGASADGREFAAKWAEVIFTNRPVKQEMQKFYENIKTSMGAYGRAPETCAILPSVEVIVAETEALARERADYLDSFAAPELGLEVISSVLCRDLSEYPLDTLLTDIEPGANGPSPAGVYQTLMALRKNGRGLTLREAAILQATTHWSPRLVGTPSMVGDELQDVFESNCCDGFIITQALSPGGLIEFVDTVVPELQRRGIYRREYTGRTFRENLRS